MKHVAKVATIRTTVADTLRILLVDDHQVMREGLRAIVKAQGGTMEVVGEAADGATAVAMTRALAPDVVVMDLSMPTLGGLPAAELIRRADPHVKVVVLTRYAERASVQQELRAGVSGYILKRSAAVELIRAINHVAAGQTYLDPAVTRSVVADAARRSTLRESGGESHLTERESAVLRLIARGWLSKDIAARLRISAKTVDTHKANAMSKLGLSSRVDIMRYASMLGWLHDI